MDNLKINQDVKEADCIIYNCTALNKETLDRKSNLALGLNSLINDLLKACDKSVIQTPTHKAQVFDRNLTKPRKSKVK